MYKTDSGYVVLSHEPFGRCEVVRRITDRVGATCSWCGAPARWEYGTRNDDWTDDSRIGWSRPYCSVSCCRCSQ